MSQRVSEQASKIVVIMKYQLAVGRMELFTEIEEHFVDHQIQVEASLQETEHRALDSVQMSFPRVAGVLGGV